MSPTTKAATKETSAMDASLRWHDGNCGTA